MSVKEVDVETRMHSRHTCNKGLGERQERKGHVFSAVGVNFRGREKERTLLLLMGRRRLRLLSELVDSS